MLDLDFLTREQISGNNRLEIFEKYGTKAAITDFAILLGGYVSNDYTSEGKSGKNRTGWWWTKTPCSLDVQVVANDGSIGWNYNASRASGARPVLPYSLVSSISSNKVRRQNGILEVEYGEYPQTIVDENYSCEIEEAYNSGILRITERKYTTDAVKFSKFVTSHADFQAKSHTEYEYKGNKYIRFVGDLNGYNEFLSDGRQVQTGNIYWIKVEPIVWLVDEKSELAIAKKILFSGVQYNHESNYKGDFKNTDVKKFMDTFFSKEIIQGYNQTNINSNVNSEYDKILDIQKRKERFAKIKERRG